MAAAGFAAGLASGIAQGAQIAQTALYHADLMAQRRAVLEERRQYHQERAEELAAMRKAREESEFDRKVAAAGRQYQISEQMLQKKRQEAAQWLAANPDWKANPQKLQYAQQLEKELADASAQVDNTMKVYANIGSDLMGGANGSAGNLAEGKHGIEDADPDHLAAAIHQSTGLPHQAFLPDETGKRPVDDIAQQIQQGMQNFAKDGGETLLHAAQPIINQQLQHYVGRRLPDGTTVVGPPHLVTAPPLPNDPNHVVPVISFPVQRPDGSLGEVRRPYLGPDQDMLAPMDQVSAARVHPWSIQDIGGYLHSLLSISDAARDPKVQDKLAQAHPNVPDIIDLGRDIARTVPQQQQQQASLGDFPNLGALQTEDPVKQAQLQYLRSRSGLTDLEAKEAELRIKKLKKELGAQQPQGDRLVRIGENPLTKKTIAIYERPDGTLYYSEVQKGGAAPTTTTTVPGQDSAFTGQPGPAGSMTLPPPPQFSPDMPMESEPAIPGGVFGIGDQENAQ